MIDSWGWDRPQPERDARGESHDENREAGGHFGDEGLDRVSRALVSISAVVFCGLMSTTAQAQPGGRRSDSKPGPLATSPGPTQAEHAAATEAFHTCREQEKEGDARACWRLWLKKYKTTGSEAEIAYAEDHQGPAAVKPSGNDAPAPKFDKDDLLGPSPAELLQRRRPSPQRSLRRWPRVPFSTSAPSSNGKMPPGS